MLKKNLKFYLIALLVCVFAISGVVLADTIINHYYGNVDLEQNAGDGMIGGVTAIGGICDGSEPTTQMCNVNVYELESQTTLTSADGVFSDDVTIADDLTVTGEIMGLAKTTAVAQTTAYATTTLTAAQSGTTFLLSATGSEFILPATSTSAGVWYRFVVDTAGLDSASTTIWSNSLTSSGDELEGSMLVAGATVDCNAADYIKIGYNTENIGDYVEVVGNGSDWLILGSDFKNTHGALCGG